MRATRDVDDVARVREAGMNTRNSAARIRRGSWKKRWATTTDSTRRRIRLDDCTSARRLRYRWSAVSDHGRRCAAARDVDARHEPRPGGGADHTGRRAQLALARDVFPPSTARAVETAATPPSALLRRDASRRRLRTHARPRGRRERGGSRGALPAEPLSDGGSARTTLLRGEDIVDLVRRLRSRARLLRRAIDVRERVPRPRRPRRRRLRAAPPRTVDWDAYDDAYAAALARLPRRVLSAPRGCTFGCLPLKTTAPRPSSASRPCSPGAANVSSPRAATSSSASPHSATARPRATRPTLARVLNRVASPSPPRLDPRHAGEEPVHDPDQGSGSNPPPQHVEATESRLAPAAFYVGADPRTTARPRRGGLSRAERFRGGAGTRRHVGCGVWLGRRTSRAIPGTSPGPSPPSATSRSVPSWRRWWNERCAI